MSAFDIARDKWPGWEITGWGYLAVTCESAKRITLVDRIDRAYALRHDSCGEGCDGVHHCVQIAKPETVVSPSMRKFMEAQ